MSVKTRGREPAESAVYHEHLYSYLARYPVSLLAVRIAFFFRRRQRPTSSRQLCLQRAFARPHSGRSFQHSGSTAVDSIVSRFPDP